MKTLIKEEYPESKLTAKIIGCAMEVHRHLGNGFQEVVYQRAWSMELNRQQIKHHREKENHSPSQNQFKS
ncbi:MAG: GxxExxY protein [Mangrovibacterium sp.]